MTGRLRALPFALAIILLFAGSADALEVQTATIVVQYGNIITTHQTISRTVGDFLAAQGIELAEDDVVTPAAYSKIANGLTITINRAFPIFVNINQANGSRVVETTATAGTVFDFVARYSAETGLRFVFDYSVQDNQLSPFLLIHLDVVEEVSVNTYLDVAYEEQTRYTDEIFIGSSRVEQEGVLGIRTISEHKIFQGAEVVFRRIESDEITTEPINKIVYVGTAPIPTPPPTPVPTAAPTPTPTPRPTPTPTPVQTAPVAAIASNAVIAQRDNTPTTEFSAALIRAINPPSGPTEYRDNWRNYDGDKFYFTRTLTVRAFAYEAGPRSTGKRPGDPAFGITASGLPARVGVVAVDPNVIPLFTKLYVVGYGFAIAADTGGRHITGNTIDIFFDTVEECLQFGIRNNVRVYVIEHLGNFENALRVLYEINPICLLYRHSL